MSGGSSGNNLTQEQKNQLIKNYNEIEKELKFGDDKLNTEYTDLESDVIDNYNIIHKLDYLAYLSIKEDIKNLNLLLNNYDTHEIFLRDRNNEFMANKVKERIGIAKRVLGSPQERYNYFESSLYAWQYGDKSDPNNPEIKIESDIRSYLINQGYSDHEVNIGAKGAEGVAIDTIQMLETFPKLLNNYGINLSIIGIIKKEQRFAEKAAAAQQKADEARAVYVSDADAADAADADADAADADAADAHAAARADYDAYVKLVSDDSGKKDDETREKEIEARKKAIEARRKAVEDRKKAVEARRKAFTARNKAVISADIADNNANAATIAANVAATIAAQLLVYEPEKKANEAKGKADEARKKADEARKKANEARKKADQARIKVVAAIDAKKVLDKK